MFDSQPVPSPERHSLEDELFHDWNSSQNAQRHVAATFEKILEAWRQDRSMLGVARLELEELRSQVLELQGQVQDLRMGTHPAEEKRAVSSVEPAWHARAGG